MKRQKTWTVANIISALRICAAPFVLVFMYLEKWINNVPSYFHSHLDMIKNPWITVIASLFFIFAAVSDIFDGYIARKRGEVSQIGKFLDPLADKILVTTALIMLVHLDWAPAWVAILIITREISITALRSMASAEGVIIAAGPWGKRKTFVQSCAIAILLLHYDHFGIPIHYIGTILLYVALILTLYSGYDYMKKYFTERQKPPQSQE